MFKLCHLGKNNWVFIEIYKEGKILKSHFIKHIHGNIEIKKYDYIFDALEMLITDTKKEMEDIISQFVYQIEEGLI